MQEGASTQPAGPRISAAMEPFRLNPGERTAQEACDGLAAIGTDDVLPAIVEIFRKGEKVRTDENGSIPFQPSFLTPPSDLDYADIPVRTLVSVKTPFSVIKKHFSNREYEEVVFRCWRHPAFGFVSYEELLDAMIELGSSKVSHFLQNLLLNDREGRRENALIEALSKIGANHLSDLLGNFYLPIVDNQMTRYQNNILKILSACGDRSCVETILKVARDGSTVANQARSTLRDIASRDPSIVLPDFCMRPAPILERPTPLG